MTPPSENPPPANSSTQEIILEYIKVLGDGFLASLKLQNACAGLQNARAGYTLRADQLKFSLLKGLLVTAWLNLFVLIWIACILEFQALSIHRPTEIELRLPIPAPVEPPHEMQRPPAARSVA